MCEFNVFLKGKMVFSDVIYAKIEGNRVILKNILGDLKEFHNCKINEVDVSSERLVLSKIS